MASAKKNRNIVAIFFESVYGALTPDRTAQASQNQQVYRSFRAKALSQRTLLERMSDSITAFFGSVTFALIHIIWFGWWILANLGYIGNLAEPFDPYPFGLLTMIVSLEAIFLSVFVLISQNRESQISDLREEVDFQINMNAEREITKMIGLVHEIHEHLGLAKAHDHELEQMKRELDPEKIEQEIVEESKQSS